MIAVSMAQSAGREEGSSGSRRTATIDGPALDKSATLHIHLAERTQATEGGRTYFLFA